MNKNYNDLVKKILYSGYDKMDYSRDINTKSIPYHTIEHNMDEGFPLLTTKKLNIKNIISELVWFVNGNTDIRYLWSHNNKIWDGDYWNWVNKNYPEIIYEHEIKNLSFIKDNQNKFHEEFYSLGKIYGYQWRKDNDALVTRLWNLMKNPLDRGHLMNAWCENDLNEMALRPCHTGFKIVTYKKDNGYEFTLIWSQRSVDVGLGLPYNIASYALLGKLIESITQMKFKNLVGHLSDVHIYENHIPKMEEILQRDENKYKLPNLKVEIPFIDSKQDLTFLMDTLKIDNFQLSQYESYPFTKMEMLAPIK